jgi:kynurenine formamidase
MRDVPDSPFDGWRPPEYTVDADGKVVGARPGEPHNWGRWGHDDQRGTANLLTREATRSAATLVRTGATYSLGLPIGRTAPNVGSRPDPHHLMTRTAGDQVLGDEGPLGLQSSDDLWVMPLQGSTQLDGFAHVGAQDTLYNGYWAGLVTAQSGARRLGIHNIGAIVTRGVLLDVHGVLGSDPFETPIDVAMLEEVAAKCQVDVGPGDALLVRTGFLTRWLDDPDVRRRRRQSGLTGSTAAWLAERDVALVGADNRAVEVLPDPDGALLPFHIAAIRDLGLLVGELFDLDVLAAACSADGVYEFLFIATPLPIVNAVGTPVNPVAVK